MKAEDMGLNVVKKSKGSVKVAVNKQHIAIAAVGVVVLYFLFFSSGPAEVSPTRSNSSGVKVKFAMLPEFVRKDDDLKYIVNKAREMQVDVADFWLAHGPDQKYGGFYGTLDRQGKPASPSYKGLIQQARHLLALCYMAEHFSHLGPQQKIQEVAVGLYHFIKNSFYDAGSEAFFYIVSPDGREKLEPGKQLYANMHGVAAFAYYGRVFKDEEALQIAVAVYNHWEKHTHDNDHGGWDESKDVPKLKSDDARTVKGVDTHLHVMDALMRINEAVQDVSVPQRLTELYNLFMTKFINRETNLMMTEFSLNWKPLPEAQNHVSYGHDLTAVWMVFELAKELGSLSEEDKEALTKLGGNAMERAYDKQLGGFFEYGSDDGTVHGRDHTWWVQCQAMLGAWKLYEHTCNKEYLGMLRGTMEFVDKYMWDKKFGEWYWGITEFGEVSDRGTNKGNEWKASLHTTRTLVLLDRWITARPVCRTTQ